MRNGCFDARISSIQGCHRTLGERSRKHDIPCAAFPFWYHFFSYAFRTYTSATVDKRAPIVEAVPRRRAMFTALCLNGAATEWSSTCRVKVVTSSYKDEAINAHERTREACARLHHEI